MEDTLKLKRLLVTMKQQYEKSLHQAQLQLQAELDEKSSLQEELDALKVKLKGSQTDYDSELVSLKSQQNSLKESFKKIQLENQFLKEELQKKEQEDPLREISSNLHIPILFKETEKLQDKYELLKEEWKQLSDELEEITELKNAAELKKQELSSLLVMQEKQSKHWEEEATHYKQRCETLENEKQKTQLLFEESENNLKTAQQHLAKKVKENTLQSEHIEELQNRIVEFIQTIESQKVQITQLQVGVDMYQKQEARLHEQLHEALKGTDSKIVKWEDKYFQMHEKWQQSERHLIELKKIEEKYHQVKRFLNTLKPYLDEAPSAAHISDNFRISTEDFTSPLPQLPPLKEESPLLEEVTTVHSSEKKWDLFGMSHNH